MSQFSVPTPFEPTVVELLRNRVGTMAQALGVINPLQQEFGELFGQTFVRPPGDAAYQRNGLQPGALPLEWSFAEAEPETLRLEIQPFDPMLTGDERFLRTLKALVPSIQGHHGQALASRFEAAVQTASAAASTLGFGAFVGLVQRPSGGHTLKMYVECGADDPALWSSAVSDLAGVAPHFCSVAAGAGAVSQRTYYLCRNGLRALDLETVCAELDISHRFPALLMTMLELTEGQFYFPPNAVLLGIRRHTNESELKVDLVCGAALHPGGLSTRIERVLQPSSVAPFRRWVAMICPEPNEQLPVRVVSVNVSTTRPGQLNVYAAEPWRRS